MVTSGCTNWCNGLNPNVLNKTEVYNLKTGKWMQKAELPEQLSFGQLAVFNNAATFVGGFLANGTTGRSSGKFYQYFWHEDKWEEYIVDNEEPDIEPLYNPRHISAVFQIPKHALGFCWEKKINNFE